MHKLKVFNIDNAKYNTIIIEIYNNDTLIYKKNMEVYPINKYPSNQDIDDFIYENKQLNFVNDIIYNDAIQMSNDSIIFYINESSDNIIYIPLTTDEIEAFKMEFHKLKLINDDILLD